MAGLAEMQQFMRPPPDLASMAAPLPQAGWPPTTVPLPGAGSPPLGVQHGDFDFIPDFDRAYWEPLARSYGILGLLRYRQAMLPIPKPQETSHLKFLICPMPAYDDRTELDREVLPHTRDARSRGAAGERKGKGKGGKEKVSKSGGRFVPDMGKTEVILSWQRGQWWRNVGTDQLDVIVREQFSLASPEMWKVPPGHYVQQAGPCEVFVSGQAAGLQRMPVQPRGWATVDATAVGGPKYLEAVRVPRWRVCFSSGSNKGDIVVRDAVSLESDEVAVLLCDTYVEQSGPQELLEDGIIRMPIVFAEGVGREPSSPSQPPKCRSGWVTCDATAQGGPKFFEPCPEDLQPPQTQLQAPRPSPEAEQRGAPAPGSAAAFLGPERAGKTWDKNRIWKVVNLESGGRGRQLPVVSRAEPYAAVDGRVPPEDMVIRWLHDGDIVAQVGHSKKIRGYMVMPVRFLASAVPGGDEVLRLEETDRAEGWVTRRLVEKTRHADAAWFVEIRADDDNEHGSRRRSHRHDVDD